jgi:hypothetical protein
VVSVAAGVVAYHYKQSRLVIVAAALAAYIAVGIGNNVASSMMAPSLTSGQ